MIRTALLSGILTFGTIIAGNSLAFALEDSGALETSGPIVADHGGQVIEGLRIQAPIDPPSWSMAFPMS